MGQLRRRPASEATSCAEERPTKTGRVADHESVEDKKIGAAASPARPRRVARPLLGREAVASLQVGLSSQNATGGDPEDLTKSQNHTGSSRSRFFKQNNSHEDAPPRKTNKACTQESATHGHAHTTERR